MLYIFPANPNIKPDDIVWKKCMGMMMPYNKNGWPMSVSMKDMDKMCDEFVKRGGLKTLKK